MAESTKKTYVKKGDLVSVRTGKEKGKTGKVLMINTKKDTVIVEKLNFVKKHSRPSKTAPQGGIIEKESPMSLSNVNIVCDKCNIPVRIKMIFLDDGKKVRACVKCGEILDR